jgi:hypothetical protein
MKLIFPMSIVFTVATYAVAVFLLWRVWRRKSHSQLYWLFHAIASLQGAIFVFFVGQWAYTTFYARWIFLLLYIILFVRSSMHVKRLPLMGEKPPGYILGPKIAIAVIAFLLNIGFIMGYWHPKHCISLRFPFKAGTYFVMQGGSSRLTNISHRNFNKRKYGFAMDISRLNKWQARANSVFSKNNTDYRIYGDTVIAPCDGQVLLAVDSIPNNIPGQYNTHHPHGNHIILQGKGFRVFMAHFQPHKIFVKRGQQVKEGDPLGLVGNSGFSAEPHLHFNVLMDYRDIGKADTDSLITETSKKSIKAAYESYPYDGKSVPFFFDRKYYSLNDFIYPRGY